MKIQQLENKNQFVIDNESEVFFQSYNSLIARYDRKKQTLQLSEDWNYSNTTRKHLYLFIRNYTKYDYKSKKEIEQAILNKEIFVNLIP